MERRQTVILVVAHEARVKIGIVESLTRVGDWKDHTTAAKVRILTCKSLARVVVDTTPMKYSDGRSFIATARQWNSQNGLRRIVLGKDVIVVCVGRRRQMETSSRTLSSASPWWLDVFQVIFQDLKGSLMMLVDTEGEDVPQTTRRDIEFTLWKMFSPANIAYSHFWGQDDSWRRVIEGSVAQKSHDRNRTLKPFPVTEDLFSKEQFGPWGHERVILFGRTGSGKSTLAQMLTLGDLDPKNEIFPSSSGPRGKTDKITSGRGRGWDVLDTPGFGESGSPGSTISTSEVQAKIKQYVKMIEGTFSHYLFVVKAGRLDDLDKKLWDFFVLLFGKEMERQFSVVVSNGDNLWIQKNLSTLKTYFTGCRSFISADFLVAGKEDTKGCDEFEVKEYEDECLKVRKESLEELEECLAKLARADLHCEYGRYSKLHLQNEADRERGDLKQEKNPRIQYLVRGTAMIFAALRLCIRVRSEVAKLLKVEDGIFLVPCKL